jgi:hypothetical protein
MVAAGAIVTTMLPHALDYARRGLRVFPLAPRWNVPLGGSHGHLDATTDAEVIKVMWRTTTDANIGIATGNGVLVFDVDPRNSGDLSLDELQRAHGPLPETWTDRTPGRGTHNWYAYPPDAQVRCTKLAPGIDIKAEGGYVVAPPSVRRDGGYVWLAGYAPDDLPIAAVPPWLLQRLSTRSAGRATARRPYDGPSVPTRVGPILLGCRFMRHCRDDAATLSEWEWYAALTILARCDGGAALAHKWSRPYPRYSVRQTEAKVVHALNAPGPYTCARINGDTGGHWCRGCPGLLLDLPSPIVLGTLDED